jgi:molybdate transport system substrate-binding protein
VTIETCRAAALATAIAAASLMSSPESAVATEIKVIATTGVRAMLRALAPQFESVTGHKLVMDFANFATLKRRIEAREAFDIVIPSPDLIDELVKQGKVAADTRGLCRIGLGVGVRKGGPKPDISTPEQFRRFLLDTKAVGHSKEGQSGAHFLEVLSRLGITEEMLPKLRAFGPGGQSMALEKGEVDAVVTGAGPIMEMSMADYLGGLPPSLQSYVNVSIGVSVASDQPEAARAFVRFLTSPAVGPTFKANGVECD